MQKITEMKESKKELLEPHAKPLSQQVTIKSTKVITQRPSLSKYEKFLEHYLGIKRNELQINVTTWMNLKIKMDLSERSLTKKKTKKKTLYTV